MQVIAKGASRVKILHLEYTDGSPPYARWFHPECFADDEGIQTRAMLVDRTGTEKILERIAAEQDAAAAARVHRCWFMSCSDTDSNGRAWN